MTRSSTRVAGKQYSTYTQQIGARAVRTPTRGWKSGRGAPLGLADSMTASSVLIWN